LKLVEARTAAARDEAETEITKFNEDFRRAEEEAKKKQGDALAELQKQVDDLKKKSQEGGAELTNREVQRALQAAVQQVALKERVEQRRMDTTVERLTRERDRKLIRIERELDTEVQRVQNIYKAMALFLPMLPPLAIGLAVFMRRRALESESITPVRRK
jgi:ABC-2 type transport system permease protein